MAKSFIYELISSALDMDTLQDTIVDVLGDMLDYEEIARTIILAEIDDVNAAAAGLAAEQL